MKDREYSPARILSGFFRPVYPNDTNRKSIYRLIWTMFLPALAERALIQMTSMFDQMQVGRIGAEALSAVGLSNQVKGVLTTLFMAINVGLTAVVARSYGEGRKDKVSSYVINGFYITLLLGILVTVIGVLVARPLLILFNVPDEVSLAYAESYLKIIFIGFIPLALTTAFTAALRGVGNTKSPLFYNALSNIINIFLNWVLINGHLGFKAYGVKGAAIATVIGQTIAFLIALFVVFRPGNCLGVGFDRKTVRINGNALKGISRIGFPTMISQGASRFGIASYNAMAASLGTSLYASHVVCMDIQLLSGVTGMSCEVVSTTMSGQSLGAKRKDLALTYIYCATRVCVLLSLFLMALYTFGGRFIIGLYNNDPQIVANGILPLRIIALMQPLVAMQYTLSGAVKGAGDTLWISIINVSTKCLLRPLLAYIAVYQLALGLPGVWWAHCIAEIVCSLLVTIRFLSCKWMRDMKV